VDLSNPHIVLMTENTTFLQYTISVMNRILILTLLLAGCASPTAEIRESARQMSQELGAAQEAQDTILDSLGRLRNHTDALEDVAAEIPSPQKEEVMAHTAAIEEDTYVIEGSVDDTKEVLKDGTRLSAAILASSDRVQDKPGWWNNVLETLSGWSWWIFVIIVFVLIGTMGLWPVLVNALIGFMSSVGFGISRARQINAQRLYQLQQDDHSEAADKAVEQLRSSLAGEAAWRRAARTERRRGDRRRS